jgi:D-glycero-D-manno-heptose 1,7-bisphosphate phosphatase
MKKAVFLERDGILNHAREGHNTQMSPLTVEDFRIDHATKTPLLELKAAGFLLVVTTNQPGLSRGYQSRRELDAMHTLLRKALPLDDIMICPHDESDYCPCRKPRPGLFIEAAFKWHLDMDRSFVVSDKWQDAEAARLVGCTSLLLKSPWIGRTHHDLVLPNIEVITEKILELASECPGGKVGSQANGSCVHRVKADPGPEYPTALRLRPSREGTI